MRSYQSRKRSNEIAMGFFFVVIAVGVLAALSVLAVQA